VTGITKGWSASHPSIKRELFAERGFPQDEEASAPYRQRTSCSATTAAVYRQDCTSSLYSLSSRVHAARRIGDKRSKPRAPSSLPSKARARASTLWISATRVQVAKASPFPFNEELSQLEWTSHAHPHASALIPIPGSGVCTVPAAAGFRIGLAAVDASTTHVSFKTFRRNRQVGLP
jgi:hypothetical protein